MGIIEKLKKFSLLSNYLKNKKLLYTVISIIGLVIIIKIIILIKSTLYDKFMQEKQTIVEMYEQKISITKDEVVELKTQIAEQDNVIEEQKKMLKILRSKAPSLSNIKKEMTKSTMTDEGLYEQSMRVLKPYGLTQLVILDKCN
jgi:uncharacterized coiled-coil protein SlyX